MDPLRHTTHELNRAHTHTRHTHMHLPPSPREHKRETKPCRTTKKKASNTKIVTDLFPTPPPVRHHLFLLRARGLERPSPVPSRHRPRRNRPSPSPMTAATRAKSKDRSSSSSASSSRIANGKAGNAGDVKRVLRTRNVHCDKVRTLLLQSRSTCCVYCCS